MIRWWGGGWHLILTVSSPYIGMGNNPISGIDPDGGWLGKSRSRRWANKHGGEAFFDDVTGTWWGVAGFNCDGDFGVMAKNFGKQGIGFSFRDGWRNLASGWDGGVGYEFMNSGWSRTPVIKPRNGQSEGIIMDPTYGLPVFKGRKNLFRRDNKTPYGSTPLNEVGELLGDANKLFGYGADLGEAALQVYDGAEIVIDMIDKTNSVHGPKINGGMGWDSKGNVYEAWITSNSPDTVFLPRRQVDSLNKHHHKRPWWNE